ncbi:hypothetical protein M231_05711 [Tremella mesenterica]|uniref:F-box domain-containing protein n=1 Tax=Tremella mesenterica TaxID=5217 RepID=A0A4Q1BHD7_TREME|nr:hypothetical protein M231_05711 [Tremella mesenterica]
MDDSPTISSKLILPPDVLYEIAQILGKHGAEPTLLNLSLTSTRTYCPTTPLLFRKKHLVMDDDVVGDLLDFYSIGFPPRQNLRPRQRSAVNKDRLQGDTWNPKVIASSKSGRTAWKCQWTETLHIYLGLGSIFAIGGGYSDLPLRGHWAYRREMQRAPD